MRNIYLTTEEGLDVVSNLTPAEVKLYMLLKHSPMLNPDLSYFDDGNLANELGVTPNTVKKLRSNLKTKGYAYIVKFKDEDGEPMVRVIVGKNQLELYNLGMKYEVTNAKAYKRLLNRYPINNSTLSTEEREKMVADMKAEYLANPELFK